MKIKYKTCLFCIYFKFWRYHISCKKLEDTATSIFISCCFSISFYSSRYHFLTNFQKFIQPYLKKCFCHIFSLFTDSPKLPHLLNSQNPLSLRKVFYECSLSKLWGFYSILIWRPVQGREGEDIVQAGIKFLYFYMF